MLEGIDAMVIDLQDIGARFYTYMTTMAYVMEEAAKRKIAVVVLDRPNPIGGCQIEGPALDKGTSGRLHRLLPAMPIRHGMTLGELAKLFNAENKIGADLTVVAMKNWRRDRWFDETGLPWINPSPNMRNLIQATLYPGIGAIEGDEPVGRPRHRHAVRADRRAVDRRRGAGRRAERARPARRPLLPGALHAGVEQVRERGVQGVFMIVTDRTALRPVRVGVEIAAMLHKLYGAKYELEAAERLFGSKEGLARIRSGEDPSAIAASWGAGEGALAAAPK